MKFLALILAAFAAFVLSACTSTENGVTIKSSRLFGFDAPQNLPVPVYRS